ncbi:MAG: IclR family transcriptional regulator [Pyramidobacter sp.]|jgi:IclR family KDG regulon transcriptional repressor
MSSLHKALLILKYMGEAPYEFGVTEIADKIGMVKSGVYKLLADMSSMGFVVKDQKSRLYRLGPAVFRLGAVYSDFKGIEEVAENVMRAIVSVTHTSSLVGLLEGDVPFLAYKVDAPGSFLYHGRVGRSFPLYAGALGKIFGAYMERNHVLEILERTGMKKQTPLTVQDKETLLKQYDEIRKNGYALSLGENIEGAFGLSVPITDARSGSITADLCLAGPLELYKPECLNDWLRLLREGANEIAYKMARR